MRKRILGEGEGDYCIYEIVPQGHKAIPAGSLVPIPNIPRFVHTVEAMKWVRSESGDRLAGKQIMVMRAMEIVNIEVSTKPTVTITAKPKIVVTVPAAAEKA